jgi:hypothetical protein
MSFYAFLHLAYIFCLVLSSSENDLISPIYTSTREVARLLREKQITGRSRPDSKHTSYIIKFIVSFHYCGVSSSVCLTQQKAGLGPNKEYGRKV